MTDIKSAIEREKEEADKYQSKYDDNFNNPNVLEEWRETQADEAEYHQQIAEWLEDYSHIKKAWEEVIKDLEYFNVDEYLKDEGHRFGCNEGICYALELINQKLSKIEK